MSVNVAESQNLAVSVGSGLTRKSNAADATSSSPPAPPPTIKPKPLTKKPSTDRLGGAPAASTLTAAGSAGTTAPVVTTNPVSASPTSSVASSNDVALPAETLSNGGDPACVARSSKSSVAEKSIVQEDSAAKNAIATSKPVSASENTSSSLSSSSYSPPKKSSMFSASSAVAPAAPSSTSAAAFISSHSSKTAAANQKPAALSATTTTTKVAECGAVVGFSELPNQIRRISKARGFQFNVMVVGAPGLGKSTFLRTLLPTQQPIEKVDKKGDKKADKKDLEKTDKKAVNTNENEEEDDDAIGEYTFTVEEEGVQMCVNLIVCARSFGDKLDNSRCAQSLCDEIDRRFQARLISEHIRSNAAPSSARSLVALHAASSVSLAEPDPCIHACVYLLAPTRPGRGISPLDAHVLDQLQRRVHLIPILPRADSLTTAECSALKSEVAAQLKRRAIRTYAFPANENVAPALPPSSSTAGAANQSAANQNHLLSNMEFENYQSRRPFALIGASSEKHSDQSAEAGRKYPWGHASTNKLEHNDFFALKRLLFSTHTHHLISTTHLEHYERYRQASLARLCDLSGEAWGDELDGEPANHSRERGESWAAAMHAGLDKDTQSLLHLNGKRCTLEHLLRGRQQKLEQKYHEHCHAKNESLKQKTAEMEERIAESGRALHTHIAQLDKQIEVLRANDAALNAAHPRPPGSELGGDDRSASLSNILESAAASDTPSSKFSTASEPKKPGKSSKSSKKVFIFK